MAAGEGGVVSGAAPGGATQGGATQGGAALDPGAAAPAARITASELARKVVHMAVGLMAFLLVWLGPAWGMLLAALAVLFNLAVLPRLGGRRLYRSAELAAGRSVGIVLYPVAVLLLIALFFQRLEVAAATWGILAFGDGMASIVGMTVGRARLPWNAAKSWAGTLAYWLFGTAGAAALLLWTAPGEYAVGFALAAAAAAALVAAALESMPQGLDDNIGVPLVAGVFLLAVLWSEGGWGMVGEPGFLAGLGIGAAVNLALAAAGFAARTVNPSGAVAGFLLGTTLWAFAGWRGYLLLLAFFVLGSGATKLGYRRKAAEKLAQEGGGRRGARHALANTGVAVACGVFLATTPYGLLFALALAGAFATAAADTVSSEVGQLWGRRTFLITTFRPVPRGTEGAVSLEGTAAGIAASLVIGGLGAGLGLFPWAGAAVVAVAAFLGTTLESVLGATVERRGWLDNEAMNFLNTLFGALAAAALAPLL
jgi:uncharacterized protein (TIGR00297 family)